VIGVEGSNLLLESVRWGGWLSIFEGRQYTRVMHRRQQMDARAKRWRLILGLLCIALVIFGVTVSLAHGHEQDNVSHADCGLCAAAHVAVQLAAAPALVPVAQVFTRVETYIPEARPRTLSRFALFTRPPPAKAYLSL